MILVEMLSYCYGTVLAASRWSQDPAIVCSTDDLSSQMLQCYVLGQNLLFLLS